MISDASLKALATISAGFVALVQSLEQAAEPEKPAAEKPKKAAPAKKIEDVKPAKVGPTTADLITAVQACVKAHGMAIARERIAPYAKVTEIPEAELAQYVKALSA